MKLPEHHEDYAAASALALACDSFVPDDENEWVADEARSCFNCLRRRWTASGMVCLK